MRIVIVGSGLAGIGLAEELRKLSADDSVRVITQESHGYYSRPLLSHGFSREDIETKIILKTFSALKEKNIEVAEGATVTKLKPAEKKITLNQSEISYDKLVLATGSAAFIPSAWLAFKDHFFTLNSLSDLKNLRQHRSRLLARGRKLNWAVVGGGLIGCEVASDLSKAGDRVTIFHAADRLTERQLTIEKSKSLLEHFSSLGVDVHLNQNITRFKQEPSQKEVQLFEKDVAIKDHFDGAIVATGFRPRTDLALAAGLRCERGIVTNEFLQTSEKDIYAAGDVAQVSQNLYPFVAPIRNQVVWLANYLLGKTNEPWALPKFTPVMKVHGFKA